MGLAHRTIGEGPPIVLLNGYAATSADWDPSFLEALGAGSTVICPDFPGMGDSPLAGDVSVESMAADVAALMEELGTGRSPVAGWSMGGFVAQELARSEPGRVEALALVSTDPGGPDAVRCALETWERLCDRTGTPREQASRLISLLFPPDFAEVVDRDWRCGREGEGFARPRRARCPGGGDGGLARGARGRGQAPAGVPTLAAAGAVDQVIPPENAALLAGDQGRREIFDGGGHAFMAQQPDRLAGLLLSFFGRAPGGAGAED